MVGPYSYRASVLIKRKAESPNDIGRSCQAGEGEGARPYPLCYYLYGIEKHA